MAAIYRQMWWKVLAVLLVLYTVVGGLLLPAPRLPILHETIRNLYFHVPMWFAMMILLFHSLVSSILYLLNEKPKHDLWASEMAKVALVFGFIGLTTGMLWANFTWGSWWVNDPRLNGAAVGLLIFIAYFVLRGSIEEGHKRARVSAVYNIFAFVMFMVFINVIPRLTDSLHPGSGGNPAFSQYDLDNRMRMIFYPAVIGWTMFGFWIVSLGVRLQLIEIKSFEIGLKL